MPVFVLIGLGGGFASAVLFASAASGGTTGRVLLYVLAPLPSFLAGLGWGSASAAIAALAGSTTLGAMLGLKACLLFFVTEGVPTAVLCHLALLNRPLTGGAFTSPAAPAVQWYPAGRLVAAATLMAAAFSVLSLLVLGPDLETLRQLLHDLIEKVFSRELPGLKGKQLTADETTAIADFALYVLPGATSMMWLGGTLLNLWLAGRITLASGRLARPWPDLGTMTYPRGFAIGLAAAFALTFAAGYPGLLGSSFAGAFFLAYVLLGLAIIHYVTRGSASRPFLLWAVYLALIVLNTWAALLIALLALMEPFLPWRRSSGPRAPPPD